MKSVRERLDTYTERRGPEDCWLWTGSTGNSGTATIVVNHRSRSARRVLWELDHGPADSRALIMVSCGEKLCLNPAHHYLKSLKLEDLFWQHVRKTDGCWWWDGCQEHGYGVIYHLNHHYRVHRLSYEMHVGEIPKNDGEWCVCHHCDNPRCVRPDHLFLGRDKDNHDDMIRKGRHAHGPKLSEALRRRKMPLHRLTPEAIAEIRTKRRAGRRAVDVAREHGIAPSTVYAPTTGRRSSQPSSVAEEKKT